MKQKITIGILAHVDAGKTTLSEALLYTAGSIAKPGRVDHGSAFLDTFALERARGITIFSKQARFSCGDVDFTLVDTPGHADFSAETERTLQILDYAILVISATDGVQSHTETLWRLLGTYKVPCFLFVNKTDLPGPDHAAVLRRLREKLSPACVDFSAGKTPAFYEEAALCDEGLLEEYEAAGMISRPSLSAAVRERRVFPCYFGAALRLTGVEDFLRGLETYAEAPAYPAAFAGRVYKVTEEAGGRLTWLKVTGGTLRVREVLQSEKNAENEKVHQIRLYSGEKYVAAEEAPAGSLCAVTGVTFAAPGDGLGAETDGRLPLLSPVLTYSIQLPAGVDVHTALLKLRLLQAEDPLLDLQKDERSGEVRLRVMGEMQLEILQALIKERFGWDVRFGQGGILYKETIEDTVEGVGHFEPLRHYAEVHLILKPGKRGSGLVIRSNCPEDQLDRNWQRLILTHLHEKTHVGVLTGAPLTDLEIILASGRAHLKHTEGGDFRQATYRAVRQGLMQAKSVLLEPVFAFTLRVPAESVGRAMTDLERLHAVFGAPEQTPEDTVITGTAPAATLRDYGKEVVRYTRGRGSISCVLHGYAPCHNADEVIAAAAYDPEADAENPCDSVFCSHGAGHTVKWNEVPRMMHLSSALEAPRRSAAAAAAVRSPKRPVGGGRPDVFALDKELMQIFEQTYGAVKNRSDPYNVHQPFSGGNPRKKEQKDKTKIPPTYTGKEYLLVDGYNVIYSWDGLRKLSEQNMEDARDALIRLLCNYRGYRQNEVILVFDAYRVKGGEREIEQTGGISVVYTKEAETADTYIEKTSHELAKDNRVRVVTSDGMEQIIILGSGALRVSSEAFFEELTRTQQEINEIIGQ